MTEAEKQRIEKQRAEKAQGLMVQASQTTSCSDFENWTSKDMTTAFFEVFGRYIKNPNRQDFFTVKRIFDWACHGDKALLETIRYTLKWAGTTISQEYKKWMESEV